jgi:hypothetical protein
MGGDGWGAVGWAVEEENCEWKMWAKEGGGVELGHTKWEASSASHDAQICFMPQQKMSPPPPSGNGRFGA